MNSLDVEERAQNFLDKHNIFRDIKRAVVNSDSSILQFVTYESLTRIWERTITAKWLSIFELPRNGEAVEEFRETKLKILSILVTIGFRRWKIYPDKIYKHLDASIPFTQAQLEHEYFLGNDAENFHLRQPWYTPMMIGEGQYEKKEILGRLPFIRKEQKELGSGSYGEVTKEVIVAYQYCHEGTPLNKTKEVARKRFRVNRHFKIEAENLRTLNSRLSTSGCVVGYLAVFVTFNPDHGSREFNILLPLADMDLQKYIYDHLREVDKRYISSDTDSHLDLLKGACMVSKALKWLHDDETSIDMDSPGVRCYHMDLKLENILVFFEKLGNGQLKDRIGIWKITDFGISRLEARTTKENYPLPTTSEVPTPPAKSLERLSSSATAKSSRTAKIIGLREPGPFSAPEIINTNSYMDIKSDVWSFGCVLFQLLVREAAGEEELRNMDRHRGSMAHGSFFYNPERNGLSPDVQKWLEKEDGDFRVADTRKLILWMLAINPKNRPRSGKVTEVLLDIVQNKKEESVMKNYPWRQNASVLIITVPGARPLSPAFSIVPENFNVRRENLPPAIVISTPGSPRHPNPPHPDDKMTLINSRDTKTLKKTEQVITQLSPSGGVAVFITEKNLYIQRIQGSEIEFSLNLPGCKGRQANIAGNYLIISGREGSSNQETMQLFKVWIRNTAIQVKQISVRKQLRINFDRVTVSSQGSLLFEEQNCAWLYRNWDDSKEIKLEIPNREKIRKSWFSGNGIFVFVQSSAGTRTYNFRVWRVIPSISPPTLYQYQHERDPLPGQVTKSIIPFFNTQDSIVWNEDHQVYIIGPSSTQKTFKYISGLQAVTVTPDGKHIVFVTKGSKGSEFSTARILHDDDNHLSIGAITMGDKLRWALKPPEKCAVAITQNETDDTYTLCTAYPDGKLFNYPLNFIR